MNKRLARMAMFLALAVIMGYLEALVPVVPMIPGIKLGLANFVIVLVMYLFSIREAAVISVLRIILVGFLLSNMSMILYSLAGAALSLTVMALLKRIPYFSIYGISMAGGIMHNIGQLLVAGALMGFQAILWYMPFLLMAGMLAGLLIGFLVRVSCSRLKSITGERGF
ncbi:MAG: Gx transporter family protein [Lachnospiraceae bacterium]|nr:Gx transporter family protein [Lachnospiraceae bacterium]